MACLLLLGVLFIYMFRSSWLAMSRVWMESEDFSHGFLIPLVSAWLVWRKRDVLARMDWRPHWLGLVLFFCFALLWVAGELAGVSAARGYGVVGMLIGLILLMIGRVAFMSILFPVLFLFAMVPAGNGLTSMLMEQTATVTVGLLRLTGIPVYREGMHFVLPSGRWSVVEACSGLRYVIAAAVLALLFSYLNYKSWFKRIVFFVGCVLLALVANWFRAYFIVLIGHFSNMKYGVGDDHVWYGWIFFGLVMICVFWLGTKFGDAPADSTQSSAASLAQGSDFVSPGKPTAYVLFALVALSLAVLTANLPRQLQSFEAKADFVEALKQGNSALELTKFPYPVGYQDGRSVFEARNQETYVWASYFARQHDSKDMLAWGQRLVQEKEPGVVVQETVLLKEPEVLSFGSLRQDRITVNGKPFLLWQWFVVGEKATSSPTIAKILRFANMVVFRGDHSTVVVLATPDEGNPELARKRLLQNAAWVNQALVRFGHVR